MVRFQFDFGTLEYANQFKIASKQNLSCIQIALHYCTESRIKIKSQPEHSLRDGANLGARA